MLLFLSLKKKKNSSRIWPNTYILYKKTIAGLNVISDSLSAATVLTSHLPPLPLKTLNTLPSSSFAENKS